MGDHGYVGLQERGVIRQLAEQAGVSNPYLSQIERGLRRPSAEVLQQIARALRISAEQLYVRAGIVSPDEGGAGSVELAIRGYPGLTERQKQTLLDVYSSFLCPEHLDEGGTGRRHQPHRPGSSVATPLKEIDMAKGKFDIKNIDLAAPLYAGVGVADLAVGAVRGYVAGIQTKYADVQKDVTTRVADVQKNVASIDYKPAALCKQAVTVVNARVEALTAEAKARRAAIEAKVAALQSEAKELPAKVQTLFSPAKVQTLFNDNVATVNSAYADLAKRGQDLVGRIRNQESTQATVKSARTTVTKANAKTTTTQAKKAATKKTSAAKKTAH